MAVLQTRRVDHADVPHRLTLPGHMRQLRMASNRGDSAWIARIAPRDSHDGDGVHAVLRLRLAHQEAAILPIPRQNVHRLVC